MSKFAEGYPQLTTCRWCEYVLTREKEDGPWVIKSRPPFGDSTECEEAPNPEDGPMPPHEPGTAILSKPTS